jgi:hypothetical protein
MTTPDVQADFDVEAKINFALRLYEAANKAPEDRTPEEQAMLADVQVKTVTFSRHSNGYYVCSEPDNQAGAYVKADDFGALAERGKEAADTWLTCTNLLLEDWAKLRSEKDTLKTQLAHILKAVGGEIRDGGLVFSPEKYTKWCRRRGDERTQEIATQNESLLARVAELEKERDEALEREAFWLGEGYDTRTDPDEIEYFRLLAMVNTERTPEQTARIIELARLLKWRNDADLQFERANQAESALALANERAEAANAETTRLKESNTRYYETLNKIGVAAAGIYDEYKEGEEWITQLVSVRNLVTIKQNLEAENDRLRSQLSLAQAKAKECGLCGKSDSQIVVLCEDCTDNDVSNLPKAVFEYKRLAENARTKALGEAKEIVVEAFRGVIEEGYTGLQARILSVLESAAEVPAREVSE